jgi:hypothetical protein
MTKRNGTATAVKTNIEGSGFSNGFDQYQITGVTFTGKPRQYRADCQTGQFKIGAGKFLGKTLNLEVLAFRKLQDELFGYDFQTWLEIIFIDPENIIAHAMFKTESLDNFDEMLLEIAKNGQAAGTASVGIACGIVTATMVPRSSRANGTSYHAVEFTWKPNAPERIEEIKAFAQTLPYESLTVHALPAAE